MARRNTGHEGTGRDDDQVLEIPSGTDWAALMNPPGDEGDSVREIADATNTPITTVRDWVAREMRAGRLIRGTRGGVAVYRPAK
jgi:hypothetical protein